MVKFSNEFREKVVLEYLSGGGGSKLLAKKYGIGSHQTILDWVNRYQKYGDKAFNVCSNKEFYDGSVNGHTISDSLFHINPEKYLK
ncbi:transposase [Neobacillus sp. PS3-12]|uniref:transposase n=1 Tax=Neobacillus sp. PS3-12 TaxID=3070677 RepID=UPI0027E1A063|nr:transposase [Neobacillus sp. PS3-12]WML53428.1 transposase [Neobacillus sp. PS3-12]